MRRPALLAPALLLAVACGAATDRRFPVLEEAADLPTGEIVSRGAESPLAGGRRFVEYGWISLPENHAVPGDRRIQLPVVRFPADSSGAGTPLFLLHDGPGRSNLRDAPPTWTMGRRDVVVVGYRGVDGSVSLDCPGIASALTVDGSPLSPAGMERLERRAQEEHRRLIESGIDLDRYTIRDVVDDLESVRQAFGYEEVDLYAEGFGTRLALLWAARRPDRVRRNLSIGVLPPGHLLQEPQPVEEVLLRYSELWLLEGDRPRLAKELPQAIHTVLDALPRTWMFTTVERDKVRYTTSVLLRETRTAAQAFDAFSVGLGDDQDGAGLAEMCHLYDRMVREINWGDVLTKAGSAGHLPGRDRLQEMNPPDALLGAPVSQVLGVLSRGGWPVRPLPEELLRPAPSDTETLMVLGSLDPRTPARWAREELLPVLTNGRLVVLQGTAHFEDVVSLQPEAFSYMANAFLLEGRVDASRFVDQPVDLTPKETLVARGHARIQRRLLAGAVLVAVMFLGRWLYVRLRQSIQRPAAARRSEASASGS